MKILKHDITGVEAPAALWEAAGWRVYYNTEIITRWPDSDMKRALPLAVIETGGTGPEALAWAIKEVSRQSEERTRVTAINREAKAIRELASALRGAEESKVLEQIMGRLTERTQYAVRQQLKRGG